MLRKALLIAVAATAVTGAVPAAAQVTGPPPPKTPDPAAPPRKVGEAYAARLAAMPDFNGVWTFTQPNPKVHVAIFDPSQAVVPYQWSLDLPAFGPNPGSYEPNIPYNAEWAAKYRKAVRDSAEGRAIDDAGSCRPNGMPRLMGGTVGGFDLIETPDVILMHFQQYHEFRKVFLDGRPHPPAMTEDGIDNRTWSGHSVGHWEGDTLVVDTANMLPSFFDQTGARTSGEAHLVERLHLFDANTLVDDMTITDPVAFTRPWNVTRIYVKTRQAQNPPAGRSAYRNMRDGECVGVDMSKGYQTVVLPMELEAREAAKAKAAAPARKAPARRRAAK
jgi:hypothetical protein